MKNQYCQIINTSYSSNLKIPFYQIYFNNGTKGVKVNSNSYYLKSFVNKNENITKAKIVIDYKAKYIQGLFKGYQYIEYINFIRFDRTNITNMSYMFCDCSSLKEINFTNFNTDNVSDMNNMLYGCSSLNKINLSNFNTNNVTNMKSMFCTNNVTDIYHMFFDCFSLNKLNINNFNFNKALLFIICLVDYLMK